MHRYHGTADITPEILRARYKSNHPDGQFFAPAAMSMWDDTMGNFGVRLHESGNWELYRKKPVRGGINSSAMFKAETFEYMPGEFETTFDPEYEGNALEDFFQGLNEGARYDPSKAGKLFGTCGGKL